MEIPELRLAKVYEPWLHSLAIGFPLISAIIALPLDYYHELNVGHFCWLTGRDATNYGYLVAAAPFFLWIVMIPLNNVLVYRHVKQKIQVEALKSRINSLVTMRASTTSSNSTRTESDIEEQDTTSNEPTSYQKYPQRPERSVSCGTTATATTASHSLESESSTFSDEQVSRKSNHDMHRQHQLHDLQHRAATGLQNKRLQKFAVQGYLYVGSFMLTHLPTAAMRVASAIMNIQPDQEADYFWLLLAQAVLLPLQGLFNYFIYCRAPAYLREVGGS